MKNTFIPKALLFAGCATLSLALSPILRAQDATNVMQDTKQPDSTADQHSSTTGTDQTGTLGQNSKDTSSSLDKNPSNASTDSADTSGTKAPSGVTNEQGVSTTVSPSNDSNASGNSTQMSDKDFLLKAAQGGMTEVELGKLAQEKASSGDVKQFGSMMVSDHSKANDELKAVAEKKGITVPDSLDAKHQAMVDRLSHLSGSSFDRAYVHAMVRAHEKDAAAFREASTNAQDPDVKAFAGNTLPVIESHLANIKSLQEKIQ